jgi:hypothetical protein
MGKFIWWNSNDNFRIDIVIEAKFANNVK